MRTSHQIPNLISTLIMPRTTIDIEATVLRELERLQKRQGKSLSQLVSELVATALASNEVEDPSEPFSWISCPMGARVDLEDKEAVRAKPSRTSNPCSTDRTFGRLARSKDSGME